MCFQNCDSFRKTIPPRLIELYCANWDLRIKVTALLHQRSDRKPKAVDQCKVVLDAQQFSRVVASVLLACIVPFASSTIYVTIVSHSHRLKAHDIWRRLRQALLMMRLMGMMVMMMTFLLVVLIRVPVLIMVLLLVVVIIVVVRMLVVASVRCWSGGNCRATSSQSFGLPLERREPGDQPDG